MRSISAPTTLHATVLTISISSERTMSPFERRHRPFDVIQQRLHGRITSGQLLPLGIGQRQIDDQYDRCQAQTSGADVCYLQHSFRQWTFGCHESSRKPWAKSGKEDVVQFIGRRSNGQSTDHVSASVSSGIIPAQVTNWDRDDIPAPHGHRSPCR